MDQTSTIYSVDAGFIYAVFKLSFSKQLMLNSMKTSFAKQNSIVATPLANHMK